MNDFGISDFLEFEEKNKLFDIVVDNWKLWPYLRFTTYSSINDSSNGLVRKYRRDKLTVRKCLEIIKNCTSNNPLLKCKPRKFLIFTSSTRVPTEVGYKCFITDDLITALGAEANAAELVSQEEFGHKIPCYTKNILYCDYIEIISYIVSKLLPLLKSKKMNEINIVCEQIAQSIKNDLGIDYDVSQLKKRAQTMYIWHVFKKKSIYKLLKKANPKLIVEDCSYSASHMLINEQAHEMGIKVVELQHGFISRQHIGYNYGKKHTLTVNPDYLILFSEYWKESADYIISSDHLLPLGYPYYNLMKQKYQAQNTDNGITTILVLSQHIYTKMLLEDTKKLCNFFDENGFDYKLIYKLHPMEPYDEIMDDELFKKENVKLIDNSTTNLYECFSISNIQIGASSTAIFEGIGYNLRTILMDYPLVRKSMSGLIDKNYVVVVSDGSDAARLIYDGIDKLNSKINLFNEVGSLDRIVDFLHKVS